MTRLTARTTNGHAYYPECFKPPCNGDGCRKELCEFSLDICNRLADYEDTGLTPEQIRQVDELYAEKCRELAEYKKLEDRLCEMFDGVLPLKTAVDELERYLTEPGKPHPTHARILTYDESDWYDMMREAEKKGILQIHPCAVGDTVYEIIHDDIPESVDYICEYTVDDISANAINFAGDWNPLDSIPNVFFSREEAEEALRKLKEGKSIV